MIRFAKVLVALAASVCVLGSASAVQAGTNSAQPGSAGHHTSSLTAGRHSAGGPQTWHVLIGGESGDSAIQAEGYYPHVITIDAGDTIVWNLNTNEVHSVTFTGTCEDISCVPQCVFTVNIDISPCGSPTYDGVSALDSSGRMVPPGYNWDNTYPHGGTTYALTFTQPGADVYFDLSASGMRGVVVVNPAGTPYPFTQKQYSEQGQEQLQSDLAAGARAQHADHPVRVSANADGTHTYHVALGTNPPEQTGLFLSPANGSTAAGLAFLDGDGVGTSPSPAIDVKLGLFGLQPGSVHAVQILPGVCGDPASTTGLLFSQIFNPPAFTLTSVTAGQDGTATSTTTLTEPPNGNGPGQLRIPSSGWFINVAAGPNPDNGATSVACGNIEFHNAAVMRYLPQSIHVRVGDTVVWANDTINEIHGVTFLAGQPLPALPDWYFTTPTGNNVDYDGSTFFNSGPLYAPDAGRNQSLTLTFTQPGTFPYVDVEDSVLNMQGNVIVTPPGTGTHPSRPGSPR